MGLGTGDSSRDSSPQSCSTCPYVADKECPLDGGCPVIIW